VVQRFETQTGPARQNQLQNKLRKWFVISPSRLRAPSTRQQFKRQSDATRVGIMNDVDALIAKRTLGIVDRSVSTVVRKNKDSSAMLRR
jgi:hypothetical protein